MKWNNLTADVIDTSIHTCSLLVKKEEEHMVIKLIHSPFANCQHFYIENFSEVIEFCTKQDLYVLTLLDLISVRAGIYKTLLACVVSNKDIRKLKKWGVEILAQMSLKISSRKSIILMRTA